MANDISTLRTAGDVYTEVRTTIDGTQEICDNFSEDLVQKLVGCEKTVSPSRGEIQVAEITGLSYDAAPFHCGKFDEQPVCFHICDEPDTAGLVLLDHL